MGLDIRDSPSAEGKVFKETSVVLSGSGLVPLSRVGKKTGLSLVEGHVSWAYLAQSLLSEEPFGLRTGFKQGDGREFTQGLPATTGDEDVEALVGWGDTNAETREFGVPIGVGLRKPSDYWVSE